MAARGLVNGRDPRRSRGRDGVGTYSDGAKPNLPYRHYGTTISKDKRLTIFSQPPLNGCISVVSVSVEWHSVCLHPHLLSYICKNLLVSFASFLCLTCNEVEVGCCIGENQVDQINDELHILLHKSA